MAAGLFASLAAAVPVDAAGAFVDIVDNPHAEAIAAIAAAGITTGCNPPVNDRFCPGGTVTRGQMAAFLRRALDLPPGPDAFGDDDGTTFEADIDALAAAGIAHGCDPPADTSYCPGDEVTRAQVASLLAHALDLAPGPDIFTDDDASVHQDAINSLAAIGATRGCNPPADDHFCPGASLRRDQMATMLARALSYSGHLRLGWGHVSGPQSVDLGSVFVAESASTTVAISNDSTLPVHVDSAEFTDVGSESPFTVVPSASAGLAPGETREFTITFIPVMSGPAAAILTIEHSGTPTPLQVAVAAEGVPTADVELSMATAPSNPDLGTAASVTLTVSNGGPSTAGGVAVSHAPPPQLTFVGTDGDYDPATGLWTIGSLDTGTTASLTVDYTVADTGPIDVAANVAADTYDPYPTNNSAAATITVPSAADLALTLTAGDPEPLVGDQVDFVVTVSNSGPDPVDGATVVTSFAAGLAYIGDDGGGAYDPATATWTVGNLAPGGAASLTVTEQVTTQGSLAAAATASSPLWDPTTGDQAAAITIIAAAAGTGAQRIHLGWAQDPSSSLTVVWQSAPGVAAEVKYRRQGDSAWSTVSGVSQSLPANQEQHEVTVTGLAADSGYEYRVAAGVSSWSTSFTTRTAPAGPADFTLVFVADTGVVGDPDNLTTGTQKVIDAIGQAQPLAVLGGGDYAYSDKDPRFATNAAAIDAWLDQYQDVLANAPFIPTFGNHEIELEMSYGDWTERLPRPSGFGGSDSKQNYSMIIGDVGFISILAADSRNGLAQSQLDWIQTEIGNLWAAGVRWIIPYFHVAPFADGASHPSNMNLRIQLGSIFENSGIHIVLTAHDQSFERTYPLINAASNPTATSTSLTCYTPTDGITWVKVSPGGRMSDKSGDFSRLQHNPPLWPTAARDDNNHHYTLLDISATGTITVTTYSIPGGTGPTQQQDRFSYNLNGCP